MEFNNMSKYEKYIPLEILYYIIRTYRFFIFLYVDSLDELEFNFPVIPPSVNSIFVRIM